MALREHLGFKEHKEHSVVLELPVLMEHKEHKEHKVLVDQQELQEHLD